MVDGIGKGSAMAREAIRAAIEQQARISGPGGDARPAEATGGGDSFGQKLIEGIEAVNQEVVGAETLPQDFVAGEVEGFHEVAVQLKQADLSFRFALEVRNKLIDAYREIMRMQV